MARASVVVAAFFAGMVTCYLIQAKPEPSIAASDHPEVKEPALAATPRLPDDMRDVAQTAADHFQKREFDQAAVCYQQIIDKYSDCLYAWSNLGVVRYQQRRFDDSRIAMEKSVKLSSDDAFSRANLGLDYYQLGRYDEAARELERAVELDPKDAKSYNYLGCCYSQKGLKAKSEEKFKKAIELDSKFGDAYFNLALLLATAKPPEIEPARKNYQQALNLGVARDSRLEQNLSGG